MADKGFSLKRLFSKSNKDCCSVEIEEVDPDENSNCETSKDNTEERENEV